MAKKVVRPWPDRPRAQEWEGKEKANGGQKWKAKGNEMEKKGEKGEGANGPEGGRRIAKKKERRKRDGEGKGGILCSCDFSGKTLDGGILQNV